MESKFLLDLIIDKGYKLYQGEHLNYSSMRFNGVDSRYIKDNRIIIWGLSEAGKPPTLISPRPKILKTFKSSRGSYTKSEIHDDLMNEVLKTFSHEDIFEALQNRSIIFDLDNKIIIKH